MRFPAHSGACPAKYRCAPLQQAAPGPNNLLQRVAPPPLRRLRSGTQPLTLASLISADMAAMRSVSAGPGQALQHNLNRQQSRVRLFESGLRFVGQLESLKQEAMLAGAICGGACRKVGPTAVTAWTSSTPRPMSRQCWPVPAPSATSASCPVSTRRCTGQTARIEREGRLVGYLGACIRNWRRNSTSSSRCSSFELLLAEVVDGHLPKFRELSRFPEVRRDLALLVDQTCRRKTS